MERTDPAGAGILSLAAGSARSRLATGALFAATAIIGFTLCRRGIILSDEGYLLLQALDMSEGKVLYRDMDAFVAPGVWFLLAGLFRVVEPSVIASRMLVLVCYLATAWLCLRIAGRLAGPAAARGALAGYAVATVWAFPAWTWSFYSPWSVAFALAALERLLAWREGGRPRDLVAVGLALGLAGVFKQNYGALAALGAAAGFAAICWERRDSAGWLRTSGTAALCVGGGGLAVLAPVCAWFLHHGALGDAFQALVVHPFGGFLGQHDIGYLPLGEIFRREAMAGLGRLTYGAFALSNTALRFDWHPWLVRGVEIQHVLLYWLPPLCFGLAGLLAWAPAWRGGRVDGGLLAALAVCGAVFLGVFPRADYNHLLNVYQPVVALAAVVVVRLAPELRRLPRRAGRAAVGAAATLALLYAGVAGYWYVDLLRSLDHEIPQRRGGVLVSRELMQMLDFEVNAMRAATRPGEPILTLPGFAMLNFLAERPMPGRYYNLYAVHIAHDQGAEVVASAEAERVRLVVADYYDFFSETVGLREYAPVLADWLRRSFEPFFSVAVDEHLFLRRRGRPLPARRTLDPLADCDVGVFDWRRPGVREHLLFDALYHPMVVFPDEVWPTRETLCRVAVPEGAELSFRVGYRQPSRVEPGTELVAELWARDWDAPDAPLERIFEQTVVPIPAGGWNSPPADERRVDLSAFGGREILLVFRTRLRGEARMNPLDFKGFSLVWQDPQIEFGGAPR